MESKWFNEKENLIKAIFEDKKSYETIGKEYGCSGSNIKKVAIRIGIILPKKRKVNPKETFNRKTYECLHCGKPFQRLDGYSNKYCSTECYLEHRHQECYQYFLNNPEEFKRVNYSPKPFKKDILNEQNGKCAICGMEPIWNDKELVFILDHIDGHASNNTRENLRLICPNCDSQLDTYKSKNKNGDRYYYRYKNRSAQEHNK